MAGFWMNETSGKLRPVIERYLTGAPLSKEDVALMRAYLRQWIYDPGWCLEGEDQVLLVDVDGLIDRRTIDDWLRRALLIGIDPF